MPRDRVRSVSPNRSGYTGPPPARRRNRLPRKGSSCGPEQLPARSADVLPGTAPATGAIPFGFQLQSGEQVTVAISSGNAALIPAVGLSDGYVGPLLDHAGETYWSAYWPYSNTVYVRCAVCVEMPTRPSSRFTADTLALIDSHPVDTLAIDLRGNAGGGSDVTIPLVTGPGQRMNALRANLRFRVYTLIDGGTFSAGLDTAMYLKYSAIPAGMTILGKAGSLGVATILAGEPRGAKPSEYGIVASPGLPQSHLSLRYSTRFLPALGGIPDTDSLYPDVAVSVRSTDYFARYDPRSLGRAGPCAGPAGAPQRPGDHGEFGQLSSRNRHCARLVCVGFRDVSGG